MPLSEEERAHCAEYFDQVDKNHDGGLSIPELIKLIRSMGWSSVMYSNEQIFDLFTEIDTDENHTVDKTEFLDFFDKRPKQEINEANIRRMLTENMDEEGFVADSDARDTLKKCKIFLPRNKLEPMLKEAQTSGNGRIEMEKMLALLKIASVL